MKRMTQTIQVRVPEEMKSALEYIARVWTRNCGTEMKSSEVVRYALDEWIEKTLLKLDTPHKKPKRKQA